MDRSLQFPIASTAQNPVHDQSGYEMETQLSTPRTSSLVDQILSATPFECRQLICQAEFSDVAEDEIAKLMPFLWQYALQNRDSADPSDLVAVGSAVRQYVAALDASRIDEVAVLLDSGHQSQVPLQIELEVAKMVGRKFEANPPAVRDPHVRLSERLQEIALAYLNPRILPRDQYAAVTMLAIQALAVMRSASTNAIVEPLNDSPFGWFRRQLRRRLAQTISSWQQRTIPADATRDLSLFFDRIHAD